MKKTQAQKTESLGFPVRLHPNTRFLLSTSGAASSIKKHNTALQKLGIDLVYFTFDRDISSEVYANLFRSPIVRGGAVTGQGLKSGIVPFLDEVDELAKGMGTVNTVVNNDGVIRGYNTDAFGFKTAIEKHLDGSGLSIQKAIIYGNGGVSGVAARVLQELGMKVTMTGRNPEHVQAKMKELGLSSLDGPFDLVVNATPVTSEPLEGAIGLLPVLEGCSMAFDHNMPEKDEKQNYLQQYCEKNDIHFVPGNDMYVPQMIKQWRLLLDEYSDGEHDPLEITESDISEAWGV